MNEQQKEYTVKQIEKYKKGVEESGNKKFKQMQFLFLGLALLLSSSLLFNGVLGDLETNTIFGSICSIIGTPIAGISLFEVIESICKKAGLENRIADLQDQLNLANLENTEEKGSGL